MINNSLKKFFIWRLVACTGPAVQRTSSPLIVCRICDLVQFALYM